MELNVITGELTVGSQIHPAAVRHIASKGFRAIVCARPDGEAPGQPSFEEVEEEARSRGIETAYLPVAWNEISDRDADAFGGILAALPKPVLAYCRSGSRCAMLWGLHEAKRRPPKDVVQQAMGAGFDLTGLLPRFLNLYRP